MDGRKRLFSQFLRRTVWAYFWGSLAVLVNALIVHGLYFGWPAWVWGYAVAIGALVAPLVALLDLWWARRQLNPTKRVFLDGSDSLEAARQAYRNLVHWPVLSVGRVMGPHLLATMGGFLLAINWAHRWSGFPIGPLEMLYLLPWYPLNAALHAIIEYLVGARQSQRLMAYLRERFGDEVVVPSRLRIPFVFKVLGVLVALGLLPLLQVAVLVYFRLESTHLAGLVVWGLFSGLVLMVAGGILLSHEVARPVQAVLEGMQAMQEGKGPVRVSTVAWDELADLALGFNNLARALEAERQRNLELYRDTVQTLAAAIDARDPYTRGHSQRVGAYAQLIARKLGWDSPKAYQLYITGLLHDIGKIGVPEAILQKTDKLSPQERQLIESHPLIGYEIVRQSRALAAHLPGIRHHHERLDGGGYPDGLKGEAIPIEARILAVADVWDALTSHRPYRPALKPAEVYSRLWQEALDPAAVRALGALWQEGALDALLEEAQRATGQPSMAATEGSVPPGRPAYSMSKTE
jgi:hypothetical protein